MKQIRQDVRRIGEENQPHSEQQDFLDSAEFELHGEDQPDQIWNDGEDEIPDKKDVGDSVGCDNSDGCKGQTECDQSE